MYKHLFPLVILLCLSVNCVLAQSILPQIRNFSQKDYGRGQTADNWAITQDDRGVIYVGNAGGILEYDGNKWRFIPVKSGAYVMSLAVDSSGTVFVGSQGEFGYLSPENYGQLTYYSLSDSIVKAGVFFSTIWKTHATSDAIIFQSEKSLFFYDYTQVKIIEPQTSFHTSFTVNDNFFVRQRDIGLMKYENGELSLIEDGALFSDIGVFAMLPFPNSDPDNYRDVIGRNEALHRFEMQNQS